MALQLDVTFTFEYSNDQLKCDDKLNFIDLPSTMAQDVTIPAVYVVVDSVNGNKDLVNFKLNYYRDSTKTALIKTTHHAFIPSQLDNAHRWDKQAYEYTKTLPEYADAIDV